MIPNRAHFVWFGRDFPFTHALAVRSLAATTRPDRIVLHVSDALEGQEHFDALARDVPVLEIRRLDVNTLLAPCDGLDRDALARTYETFVNERRWAALSDILRYLVLYGEGGVYLDLDTITVRSLEPLLARSAFCGRETILVSGAVARRRSPLRYFRTGPLDGARALCAAWAPGLGWWRRIEPLYPRAVNGAVLGMIPRHPLAHEALARVPALAPQVARRRTVIGPDLLQDLIDGDDRTFASDVTVFDPPAFYPLGPYLAAHHFRDFKRSDALERALTLAISPDTYVVHWYNDNLRKLPRPPDPATIALLADRQIFSRLARPFLPSVSASRIQS